MPPPRIPPRLRQIIRRHPPPRPLLHGMRVPTISPVIAELRAVKANLPAHGVRIEALGALVVGREAEGAAVAGEGDGVWVGPGITGHSFKG
jgi:hypothetical protein